MAAPARRARPARASVRARRKKVSWGWLAVVAALFAAFAGLAFLRVWPPLATVMSASMAPTIDTGDMVMLQRLDRPARVGDIVVVNVPDEARSRYGYPPVVIHRVVRIGADDAVSTKGDARKEPDPFTVPRRALGAHVIGRVPSGGRIVAFLTSPLGLLWLAGGAVLLIGMPLLERRREGQRTVADELAALREDRAAADARCDMLSHELRTVTEALTAHLAQLPAQLEAAVAAAAPTRAPQPPAPQRPAEAAPEPRTPAAPPRIALAGARVWAAAPAPAAFLAARVFPPLPAAPPPIAFVAARVRPALPAVPPPIAFVAARVRAALPAVPPPIAFVAARVRPALPAAPPPIAFAAPRAWAQFALADPLDQLALALFPGPRAAVAPDASEPQLAFALDVEHAPRFARPCENQLAFSLEEPASRPGQLVISTPPPAARPRWDAPPPSVVVRRRSGGLVGRALSLLAA